MELMIVVIMKMNQIKPVQVKVLLGCAYNSLTPVPSKVQGCSELNHSATSNLLIDTSKINSNFDATKAGIQIMFYLILMLGCDFQSNPALNLSIWVDCQSTA